MQQPPQPSQLLEIEEEEKVSQQQQSAKMVSPKKLIKSHKMHVASCGGGSGNARGVNGYSTRQKKILRKAINGQIASVMGASTFDQGPGSSF